MFAFTDAGIYIFSRNPVRDTVLKKWSEITRSVYSLQHMLIYRVISVKIFSPPLALLTVTETTVLHRQNYL